MIRTYSVYFLIHRKRIVYIGMSSNVGQRIAQHKYIKTFSSARWIECSSKEEALKYEDRWIRKFKPSENLALFLRKERYDAAEKEWILPEYLYDVVRSIAKENGESLDDLLSSDLIKSFMIQVPINK